MDNGGGGHSAISPACQRERRLTKGSLEISWPLTSPGTKVTAASSSIRPGPPVCLFSEPLRCPVRSPVTSVSEVPTHSLDRIRKSLSLAISPKTTRVVLVRPNGAHLEKINNLKKKASETGLTKNLVGKTQLRQTMPRPRTTDEGGASPFTLLQTSFLFVVIA